MHSGVGTLSYHVPPKTGDAVQTLSTVGKCVGETRHNGRVLTLLRWDDVLPIRADVVFEQANAAAALLIPGCAMVQVR